MCATCSHPSCPVDKPIPFQPERKSKIRRFGLDLQPEAYDRLGAALDRIDDIPEDHVRPLDSASWPG